MILSNPSDYAKMENGIVKITIPWKPIAKARPRFARGRCYDAQSKEKVRDRQFLLWAISNVPEIRTARALGCVENLKVAFILPMPKSLSQVKRSALLGKPHDKKPDLSNLAKWLEDVGNSILWSDDAILHTAQWSKQWGEEAMTVLEIEYVR